MAITSLGDMARHFSSLRNSAGIRTDLVRLTNEMGSGIASDPVAHLRGRTDRLAEADRRVALRHAEHAASQSLGKRLDLAQLALDQVEDIRKTLSADLVSTPVSASDVTLVGAGDRAAAGLEDVFAALSVRSGSEFLFSGAATDRAPLADAESMLAALRSAAAGATSPADLQARIDTFFDDPAGGFATMVYQGDDGPAARRQIGSDSSVDLGPRADDPALRGVMKALALATLAVDPAVGLSDTERGDLMRQAGTDLVSGSDPLAGARARLGSAQERVETTITRQSAALSAAKILRSELVAVDPAEVAANLKQVQTQLETQYTVTARLAGLTLAGFLR